MSMFCLCLPLPRGMLMLALCACLPAYAQNTRAAPGMLPDSIEQRVLACTACHAGKECSDAFLPRIGGSRHAVGWPDS